MNTAKSVPNRLINEKSPYLLQHAYNPVDWFPWGEEAFAKAEAEDKPVFLSVGYSTCHWCHVMAHESFENEDVAKILNDRFIAVKVDREERPDVDMVYMSVCQSMTGQGGWPLTIIMAPDKRPFFAGTYLPAASAYGMTGLEELLTGVANLWARDRERLINLSETVISTLKSKKIQSGSAAPSWELIKHGYDGLKYSFDRTYGGFGGAPKFPVPHNLLFLLSYYSETREEQALVMADRTLTAMARGGIHDQIGGGFSRYSTDDRWLVPHFEKMLYDNALLAITYLEGFRLTGNPYYKTVTEHLLSYVRKELTDAEGGFYCGQDADSEGVEGKYYVFSREEIGQCLEDDRERGHFCQWFDITERGNFEGKNIPNLIHNSNYDQDGSIHGISMDTLCQRVYEYRRKRTTLHKDDKILTSWNSMMIMACARAGLLFDSSLYREMAENAQGFIEKRLTDGQDRLFVRYRDGESAFPGNLDDYAYYSLALLTLYESTLDIRYLEMAVHRAGQMVDLFWDRDNKGFYFYGNESPMLIDRPKELYDGAIPSGNSAAAHVLLALSRLTAQPSWAGLASEHMGFLAAGIGDAPYAHCFSLSAFIRAMGVQKEVVCVSRDNEVPGELYAYLRSHGMNQVSVLFKCPENENRLARVAPFTVAYGIPEKGTLYYLCENHACSAPVTSLQ